MHVQQPLAQPDGRGGFDLSPACILLLAADTVFGLAQDTTPENADRARALMDDILSAARAGGYTQCDVLATLLARNQATPRLLLMAEAATDAAGAAAMRSIFTKHRR